MPLSLVSRRSPGLALVQLAAARGATVIGLTSRGKTGEVSVAGAAHVLARDDDELASAVESLSPRGLAVVADVAGGPLVEQLLPLLADDGRWVIAGAVAGPVVSFDLRRLYLHNRRLIGSSMHTREHFAELVRTARAGRIDPRVARSYELTDIHEAQREFGRGQYTGKIVLRP